MSEFTKDAFIKNGMDIAEVFGFKNVWVEQTVSGSVGYVMTAVVDYLNSNGHELAAQALDDAWYERDDQWWRQEFNNFDEKYLTGEALFEARDACGY